MRRSRPLEIGSFRLASSFPPQRRVWQHAHRCKLKVEPRLVGRGQGLAGLAPAARPPPYHRLSVVFLQVQVCALLPAQQVPGACARRSANTLWLPAQLALRERLPAPPLGTTGAQKSQGAVQLPVRTGACLVSAPPPLGRARNPALPLACATPPLLQAQPPAVQDPEGLGGERVLGTTNAGPQCLRQRPGEGTSASAREQAREQAHASSPACRPARRPHLCSSTTASGASQMASAAISDRREWCCICVVGRVAGLQARPGQRAGRHHLSSPPPLLPLRSSYTLWNIRMPLLANLAVSLGVAAWSQS